MVRLKHRYFLVEVERAKSLTSGCIDIEPLAATESDIVKTIKDLISELHGDFGRATTTHGFRVKYLNPATRIILIRARHGGPDKIVSSVLPFLTQLKEEGVVCRLLYTGATIRHCYKFLEKRQKRRLGQILVGLGDKVNKAELKKSILNIKQFGGKF